MEDKKTTELELNLPEDKPKTTEQETKPEETKPEEDLRLTKYIEKIHQACDKLTKVIDKEKDNPKDASFLIFCINSKSELPIYEPTIKNLQSAFDELGYGYLMTSRSTKNIAEATVELINIGRWTEPIKNMTEIPLDKTIAICDIIHPDVVVDVKTIADFKTKPTSNHSFHLTIMDFGELDIKEIFNLTVIIHRIIKYYQKYILNTDESYTVSFITEKEPYYTTMDEKSKDMLTSHGFICTYSYFTRKNPSITIKISDKIIYDKVMEVIKLFLCGNEYTPGYLNRPEEYDLYSFFIKRQ
jgi:hypothetical protein